MNDIDIPALIERLRKLSCENSPHVNSMFAKETAEQAITALDQLRWRRVGTPPKEDGYILIWVSGVTTAGIQYYMDGDKEDWDEVTHWLPLPAPPQESSQ